MDSSSSSSDPNIKPKCPQPPYYGYDRDDSYDRIMTKEELEAYFAEVDASEGFDVKTIPCSLLCGAIMPIKNINKSRAKEIQYGAKEAIKDYNQKNIEKANVGGSFGFRWYITFRAKPSDTPAEYPTTTFQARQWNVWRDIL